MINRAKMPRQLRGKGGIKNITPRTNYLFGGIKDRIRKIIPNELANIASKAAPLVAPFNPLAAGIMRGVGRFDKRGSVSDALKQGLGTFVGGKVAGMIPGTQDYFGQGMQGVRNLASDIGGFFSKTPGKTNLDKTEKGLDIFKRGAKKLENIPIIGELPDMVKQQILVGGMTSAATYVYEKFLSEEPPQEPGETVEQYLSRRKENVGNKMRSYFDNYFANDPEYSALDDEGRNAFVDRYNIKDGGMPTGIMKTNQAGVMERDYRDEGGFVPVGIKEKADDVPAMLSKNEFVMTADAVRGAGNGSIEKGAQKMYDTMKKLENRVS